MLMAGRGRTFGMNVAVVLLTALAFALPTAITLNLKRAGEDGIETHSHLQSFITKLTAQDSVEYQLTAGMISPKVADEKLAAARASAEHHLQEAAELRLSAQVVDRIKASTREYTIAVDELIEVLGAGQKQEAAQLDRALVDPAFARTITLLESQSEQLEREAKQTQQYGDLGVLLTVLLSLILVSVVQSRRRRAEVRSEAKHQGEARYRTLIDQSSDLVLVVDRTGQADFVSPSVERLLSSHGQVSHTAAGAPLHASAKAGSIDFVTALDPLDRERFATALQSAGPGSMSAGEFRLTGEHGTSTFELTVQDLTADPSVSGLVLNAHDVTERLALQQEMEHRALHDELTGLPNRALLADRFEQALIGAERAGTRVGLLLLDLDRFKEVNDTFGHHYGDELLRQIGPRLTSVLRGVDTVARLGGDEFAVLLMDVHGVDDAVEVANSLLATLSIPFHVEGVDLDVEASVGVVISGDHGEDTVTLMQHADIAMYIAKGQHLGVFAYDPMVDGHSATKLAMIGDLRRALQRDELVLYYQPKVNISTGDLVGAEALVRWQHPEHGLILPDSFIPLAERTGLINPLTRHILDMALAQTRIWFDQGRSLPISVNLSARNLHDERFADMVARLLAVHDVRANLLELEVTESAIMIDPVRAVQMLENLSDLGVKLSLDDFGAGYTSLSQLKALPISEIKIDRSFVMTMTEDPRDSLIVQSVIALGHNLGLTLVAEGVETEPVLSVLASLGCDVFQGYHMSRPIPVAAFDAWCAGRRITPMPPHSAYVTAGHT
jgi:diguanylate cyclase (GGDEF)-like protein